MNFNGIRRLYLPLRPKVRFSPGRKTPPVLSEVPHELSTDAHSKECKRAPQQFIPAGFPPHDNLQPGTEDSGGGFRGTGHGPLRPLIVSNLKWRGPCRGHYVFPAN